MTVGPYTVKVIEHVLKSREHEVQTYRLCLGILNYTKKYSKLALEDCCKMAVEMNHGGLLNCNPNFTAKMNEAQCSSI